MGYVLVKANGENTSGGIGMGLGYNTQQGLTPQLLISGTGGWNRDAAAKKYGERAAQAGDPWARLGQMAAIGGGIYGGLSALNESLASGQGGGLLNDVGMGTYGGYSTLSPLAGWAGDRAARRFHEKEEAEQAQAEQARLHREKLAEPYITPTMAGSTQLNLYGAPVGAGEGAPPYDPNNPAHSAVAEFTPSAPVGVRQSGTPDPAIVEELRRLDTY